MAARGLALRVERAGAESPGAEPGEAEAGEGSVSGSCDTPGDSGVVCLDSESDPAMTASLAGAEELAPDPAPSPAPAPFPSPGLMTRSDIDNRNVSPPGPALESPLCANLPDVVLKALESEKRADERVSPQRIGEPKKSLSEDIVFRRKCRRKSQQGRAGQKKRVSFHEDILNSTRTDNIHIDHGFVSYNPGGSYCDRFKRQNVISDRFSWCASGDSSQKTDVGQQTMSDIIGYGDIDKTAVLKNVRNLLPHDGEKGDQKRRKNSYDDDVELKRDLYHCESNSSDSNLSCQSETSSSESTSSNSHECPAGRKCDKTQKSFSCDLFDKDPRKTFMRKMYFSEADIDQSPDSPKRPLDMADDMSQSPGTVKSVLKKKRYIPTNIVEEHKKENRRVLNILPQNNFFDSFKNFYKTLNFNLSPERGLPEGTEDGSMVVEAIPCEVKPKNKYLSKSLDSGFQLDDDDEFVEINLHEQPSQNEITIKFNNTENPVSSKQESKTTNEESPRPRLTLNMTSSGNKSSLGTKTQKAEIFPENNKYVVNCESMVYEHKGVSYCYVHDTFQTEFDTPKEPFVPIPENIEKLPKITVQTETPAKPKVPVLPEKITSPVGDNLEKITKNQYNKFLQDEDCKLGVSKHLASPKKQNVNRYEYKYASTTPKLTEDINCNITDNCSNEDNTTLKGGEELSEDAGDVPPDPAFQKDLSHKSALMNRYLKNVCQKKDLEWKIRNNVFFQNKLKLENKFPSIVYPWDKVSKTFRTSAAKMSHYIDKEIIENKRISVRLLTANEPSYFDSFEDNMALECSEKLRLQIFTQPSETLHRMLKVRSPYKLEDGSWSPLLVFITDYALYVAEVRPGRTEYYIVCRLPHSQLDAIAVGPDSQYVQILSRGGRLACSLVTGEAGLASRLASSLEWAARTSPRPPPQPPAYLPLSARQLAGHIARQRHNTERQPVWFYGHVCSGESSGAEYDAPGKHPPPCDGYLMYKADARKRWEPSYFLLRSGLLYWGPHSPDSSHALRNHITLSSVLGVRRHCDSTRRPHCFELALSDASRMLLAAPDEPTASTWLQALLLHAAQALDDTKVRKVAKKCLPAGCTVLVTSHEVWSVRESMQLTFVAGAAAYLSGMGATSLLREYLQDMRSDVETLACGSIKNLTAFKIPDNDENWCVLEWSVCEARERGAGLALVFASGAELERFISAVEQAYCALTSEAFPLSVVNSEGGSCSAAHAHYETAWARMLPTNH